MSKLSNLQDDVAMLYAEIAKLEAELVRRREVKAKDIRKEIAAKRREIKAKKDAALMEMFEEADARLDGRGEVADG